MSVVLNLKNHEAHPLSSGKHCQIKENLMLLLDESQNTLLLENYDSANEVYVDQRKVLEVAQISKGEVFEINKERFVFLDQMGVYLKEQQEQFDDRGAEFHEVLKVVKSVNAAVGDPVKGGCLEKPFAIRDWLNLPVGLSFFSILLIGLQLMINLVPDVPKVSPKKEMTSRAAIVPSSKKPVGELKQGARDSNLVAIPNEKTPNKLSPKNLETSKVVVKKKRAVKKKSRRNLAAIKKQKSRYHEYVLESRFDPDAAVEHLRQLGKEVPRDTKLYRDIRKQIGLLTH